VYNKYLVILVIYKKNKRKMEKNSQMTGEFLTPPARKFVMKDMKQKNEELKVLLSYKKEGGDSLREAQDTENSHLNNAIIIQRKILDCQEKLKLPILMVQEQNIECRPGNGVRIRIESEPESKYVVIDGVCVCKHILPKNHQIIGASSHLGKALIGKKVGETGEYKTDKKEIHFTVEKIDLPSKAKWVFKYDKPIADLIDEPMPEMANG
jgi:transcription elongation GreA/GreB family factor